MRGHTYMAALGLLAPCFAIVEVVSLPTDARARLAAAGSTRTNPARQDVDGSVWTVSPTGSDSAPGTPAAPFKTIGRCAEAVASSPSGGTCMLTSGTYGESVVVNSSKPIAFVGPDDGSVLLTGVDKVMGLEWQPAKDMSCTYVTDMTKGTIDNKPLSAPFAFEQLFFKEDMMVEARWPNIDVTRLEEQVMDRNASWQPTGSGSVYGTIHDPALADFNFSWAGALVTLQVAHQFFTWTRNVSTNYTVGGTTLQYPKDLPGLAEWSVPSPYQNWGKNQYFLSGKLEALDAPGEWWVSTDGMLYFQPPPPTWTGQDSPLSSSSSSRPLGMHDGTCPPPPSDGDIRIKMRDYVISTVPPVHPYGNCNTNFTITVKQIQTLGATLNMKCCTNCNVDRVTLSYPTYDRDIPEMWASPAGTTARTEVSGDYNSLSNITLSMSNNHGLAVSGRNNTVFGVLIDHTDWLGTLTYIPLSLSGKGSVLQHSTVRYFGNAGVVTNIPNTLPAPQNGTQLPPQPMDGRVLDVSYNHIHHGGLIGKDSAALYTGGWAASGLHWHHNWVHDATEKCMRGDDQSRNMTVHHNVVFNCGMDPISDAQSAVAGFGLVLKGNGHTVYANTIFGAQSAELCMPSCVERLKAFRPQYPRMPQNTHSPVKNTVYHVLSAKCGCPANSTPGGQRSGCFVSEADPASLKLNDIEGFDFRPMADSPLVGAGVPIPGSTKSHPDVGAYQHDEDLWVPGCAGMPGC